ncbi:oxidoreductase [Mycena vitilis]|nr:oxidoreductase [Mycena vitilis]
MVFNPATDIPELGGKSILALAKKNPAHIYFSGRHEDRATALIAEVKTTVPSAQLKCKHVVPRQRCRGRKTVGVLGINHLAHALFLKLLLPTLLRSPDARVVIMTSRAFKGATGIQFEKMRTTQSGVCANVLRYPQSKLSNLLYAAELARRYPAVIAAVSVHPGIVGTEMLLGAGWLMNTIISAMMLVKRQSVATPEEGAHTQLWAATVVKTELVNGVGCAFEHIVCSNPSHLHSYYRPGGPGGVLGKTTSLSCAQKLAGELWDWTEKELESYSV